MSAPGLHWLPLLPEGDGPWLELKAERDPRRRFEIIRRMSRHRLDFLETAKLDRALEQTVAQLPARAAELPAVRLAWLSSSTINHLAPATRIAGLRHGFWLESYVAPYGQYRHELIDPSSALHAFRPQVVLLDIDPFAALPSVVLTASEQEVATVLETAIAGLRELWSRAQDLGALVVQQTIPNLAPFLFGAFEAAVPASPRQLISGLNARILSEAVRSAVPLLDLDAWSARFGQDCWFDPVRWLQARQLVSPALAPVYGDLVARILAASRGLSRKCLVLDLDNTLWGGVVGDDGVAGMVLGQGSAAGEAFAAFQGHLNQLNQRGVLLAVASKNAPEMAEAAFRHPEMILRREQMAAFSIGWNDKASSLKQIAAALNLGLDALVFFDDNPAERELIRRELPMVAVPEAPPDPALYARCLSDGGYFETLSFTGDDRQRAQHYRDNARRESVRAESTNMDDFLVSLQMNLEVGELDAANQARIVQLINKTNQFNLTTKRYSAEELKSLVARRGTVLRHFRLRDRFGDNGIISIVIFTADGGDRLPRWRIDTWLMSCRVLGRRVEEAALNVAVAALAKLGARELVGEYLPTERNGLVSDLLPKLGFRRTASGDWSLPLEGYLPRQVPIVVRSSAHE
jgi:FkbH-like protein